MDQAVKNGKPALDAYEKPYLKASNFEFFWLMGLILSFAYDRPLFDLTEYNRMNPRLFDLFFCVGLLLCYSYLKKPSKMPGIYTPWKNIVLWFAYCGMVWSLLIPLGLGKYSLFYVFKYFQGLVVIYTIGKINLDGKQKNILHILVIAAGVFVALYAIPEFGNESYQINITGNKITEYKKGAILGPLSYTYFHIGIFSVISVAMTLAMSIVIKNKLFSYLLLALSLFVAWPALFCGSRASIYGLLVVVASLLWLDRKHYWKWVLIAIVIFPFVLGKFDPFSISEKSLGIERLRFEKVEESTVSNRLFLSFDVNDYIYKYYLPFIGAGFYVAPVYINDVRLDRIGFGVHNAYLFPFEQGGIIGFVLFISFLMVLFREVNKARKSERQADANFATGMYLFLIALLLPFMLTGHFWHNVATTNLNSYIMVLFMLAVKPSGGARK